MVARVLSVLFILTAPRALAAWNPEVPGSVETIESIVLGQSREVSIVLPTDYAQANGVRYDVLYVLDAEDDGKRLLEIVRACQDRQGFIPPIIVVNVWTMLKWDRDHDLTTSRVSDVPTSGGADQFLAFLRDELHQIRVEYFQGGGNALLDLKYIPPGAGEPIAIPPAALRCSR